MRSAETKQMFPLSSVKPLEALGGYRSFCLAATREAIEVSPRPRDRSPVSGAALEAFGEVEGLVYGRCPETGSLFLTRVAGARAWADLLRRVAERRHVPAGVYSGIVQSRAENVYVPKLDWVHNTLLLQGVRRVRVLEVVTPPSDFSPLLSASGAFEAVLTVDEMALRIDGAGKADQPVEAAILLESLDRVDDPVALLRAVSARLVDGGLIFVTALVASGFDMALLGRRSFYLYPPDRANCFSRRGLEALLTQAGFTLLEVSTPGVLDVEIVEAHLRRDPELALSAFERELLTAPSDTRRAFQRFLQQQGMSSFARIVGRKGR